MPWEDAQAKTNEASKEAHAAEVYACKAHKHLESVAESQQESERARARLAEVGSFILLHFAAYTIIEMSILLPMHAC